MSANRPTPKQAPPAPMDAAADEWDEEKLEESLKRLKELHIKLRALRSTVPRMIQPFTSPPYPSPERLFQACESSMGNAFKEVREFKTLITSGDSKTILTHASQSRKKDPKNITPWRPRDDPNWTTLDP